jgi:hypothetical protein
LISQKVPQPQLSPAKERPIPALRGEDFGSLKIADSLLDVAFIQIYPAQNKLTGTLAGGTKYLSPQELLGERTRLSMSADTFKNLDSQQRGVDTVPYTAFLVKRVQRRAIPAAIEEFLRRRQRSHQHLEQSTAILT